MESKSWTPKSTLKPSIFLDAERPPMYGVLSYTVMLFSGFSDNNKVSINPAKPEPITAKLFSIIEKT